jgi:hypothetical protein
VRKKEDEAEKAKPGKTQHWDERERERERRATARMDPFYLMEVLWFVYCALTEKIERSET